MLVCRAHGVRLVRTVEARCAVEAVARGPLGVIWGCAAGGLLGSVAVQPLSAVGRRVPLQARIAELAEGLALPEHADEPILARPSVARFVGNARWQARSYVIASLTEQSGTAPAPVVAARTFFQSADHRSIAFWERLEQVLQLIAKEPASACSVTRFDDFCERQPISAASAFDLGKASLGEVSLDLVERRSLGQEHRVIEAVREPQGHYLHALRPAHK